MIEKHKPSLTKDSETDAETRKRNKNLMRVLVNKKKVEKQTQKSLKKLADVFRDTQHNMVTRLSITCAYAFGELIKELRRKRFDGASVLCPIIRKFTKDGEWQSRGERLLKRKEITYTREVLKIATVSALKALGERAKIRVAALPWIKAMKLEEPWYKMDGSIQRDALTGERAQMTVDPSPRRGGLLGGSRANKAAFDGKSRPRYRQPSDKHTKRAQEQPDSLAHSYAHTAPPVDPRTSGSGEGPRPQMIKRWSAAHRMPRLLPTETCQSLDGISNKEELDLIRKRNSDRPPYPTVYQIAAAEALLIAMKPAPESTRLPEVEYDHKQTRQVFTVFGQQDTTTLSLGLPGMALGGDDHNFLPTIKMEPRARVWCCKKCGRILWAKATIHNSPYPFPWMNVMSTTAGLLAVFLLSHGMCVSRQQVSCNTGRPRQ